MGQKMNPSPVVRLPHVRRPCGLLAAILFCLVPLAPAVARNPAQATMGIVETPKAAIAPSPVALASTVVILAETADAPGKDRLARFQALAEASNRYYALNAYGSVQFSFTFMDADGPAGPHDWYNIGPSLAVYEGREEDFVVAALQGAFSGANLPAVAHLGRVIAICPMRRESSAPRPLSSVTIWQSSEDYIQVVGAEHSTRLHISNLVLLSEEDDLGTWVHELGHTLYSKYATPGGNHRLTDRYNYNEPERRFGHVGHWDLLGTGSRGWTPQGASPTHMSSYTKEAAGWLRYAQAEWDHEYMLTALEQQRLGDAVLALDDPLSDDPACYYILEARDADTEFGAPESGVMLYHVTYDHDADHAVVNIVSPQQKTDRRPASPHDRPTLRGVAQPDGVAEYVADGFRVRLLAEAFSPYKATLRIERP